MKTLKLLKMSFAALLGAMSLSLSAATITIDPVNYLTPAGPSGNEGTISTLVNINDYMPGASSGYLIEDASPAAVDASQLQIAFDAKGVDFTVTDFTKIDFDPSLSSYDTSGLGIAFEGFLMKVGQITLVGLFDSPVSSLIVSNMGLGGISHIAYFNVSEVPVPAALFLFAPALLGFLGLRRRLIAKAA